MYRGRSQTLAIYCLRQTHAALPTILALWKCVAMLYTSNTFKHVGVCKKNNGAPLRWCTRSGCCSQPKKSGFIQTPGNPKNVADDNDGLRTTQQNLVLSKIRRIQSEWTGIQYWVCCREHYFIGTDSVISVTVTKKVMRKKTIELYF